MLSVTAFPRVHITLLDMNGGLGRVNGGIGFAIDSPRLELDFEPGEGRVEFDSHCTSDRWVKQAISHQVSSLRKRLGGRSIDAVVRSVIPSHVGLGSITAATLAATEAYLRLNSVAASPEKIVALSGRGGTSGIGITTYFHGGMVFDLGHHVPDGIDPLFVPSSAAICRGAPLVVLGLPLPRWAFLMISSRHKGPFGKEEMAAFKRLCPLSRRQVERAVHIATFQILPGALENHKLRFAAGVDSLQQFGWKKGEVNMHGNTVRHALRMLREAGALCAGMSSMGPTCYSLGLDTESVRRMKGRLRLEGWNPWLAYPRNRGRVIRG